MKQVIPTILLLGLPLVSAIADDVIPTRGIGIYPGRAAESAAPHMVVDSVYRNVALNRAAVASSSADYNLTAQLTTDGIRSTGVPATVSVSTRDGRIVGRDKEKSIDGNTVSYNMLMGSDPYIQYDWSGMSVRLDTLRLLAQTAYYEEQATAGCHIRVLASDDGSAWRVVGEYKSNALPGYKGEQTVSSDPNKAEDVVQLPLRKVKMAIPLHSGGNFSHLRLELGMRGAAWWRIYEVDGGPLRFEQATYADDHIKWGSTNAGWLPSSHFYSAWVADPTAVAEKPQWVSIDLGADVAIERVKVDWLYRAAKAEVQVSADGNSWTAAAAISATGSNTDDIECTAHGRYVRLLLTDPMSAGSTYGINEMEVWGRGGLHAEPAAALASADGKTFIGGWQLRRADDGNWIQATVPASVLGSYINVGAVPDNRFGNNMRQISESFFNSDFVYRTTFRCDDNSTILRRRHQYLNFDGINWKAQVWLNGTHVGNINGAFKQQRFDITHLLRHGTDNILEVRILKNAHAATVKVKNATNTDLNGGVLGADNPTFHATIGWDWITSTPGRNIGIWNDVFLSADDGISLSSPVVTTQLNLPDTLATITPAVIVSNGGDADRTVTVAGHIGSISFSKTLRLSAGEEREVTFDPKDYPQLRQRAMRLWWPNGYGEPYLHDAAFSISGDGLQADTLVFKAGLRQMDYKDLDSRATICINGRRLVPLGGNWGFSETNLNYRAREYDAAVAYHRDMHFNMIRNWVGQIGDDEFYDACDRHGIMVWQDFWLANPWDGPDPDDETMFLDNSLDLIHRIRRHPSIAIYVGRNEGYPPESLDSALRRQVGTWHQQLGYISSSADDGVSGHGPYWLNPAAYYFGHQTGKLHSEQGMPNVPNYESLLRMLPSDGLWPQGDAWGQHDFTLQGAQRGQSFRQMMSDRFGTPQDARRFTQLAQWLNYDGHRAMFEASQQQRQGLLMWMSHPCWPSMVWQTYDYYLDPTAAYFGIKKACEPLHIQYNPVNKTVQVVNTSIETTDTLAATLTMFDVNGRQLSMQSASVSVARDSTVDVMPVVIPDGEVRYLRLTLSDAGRHTVSSNFYVEASRPELLRAVVQMPVPELAVGCDVAGRSDGRVSLRVNVSNTSSVPALLIRLNLKGTDGEQILPVIYEDNYFALMPGEQRTVSISYREEDARGCSTPSVTAAAFGAETY